MDELITQDPLFSEFIPWVTYNNVSFGGYGRQVLLFFPNGYGASVVLSQFSYGVELAVLRGTDAAYHLDYSTSVTNDVVGYLDPVNLRKYLQLIKELPPRTQELDSQK